MTKFYWHIHHDRLVEPLTEPLENRITFIQKNKPKNEIDLRLRLMKPVKGKLPEAVVETAESYVKARETHDKAWGAVIEAEEAYDKARKAYYKTGKAYHKAGETLDKALEAYIKALSDHAEEIEALHAKECPDCPWNGQTIFPD